MREGAAPILLPWRAASAALEQRSVLVQAPAVNTGFCERHEYLIEKPGVGWHLRIDDESLADTSTHSKSWSWTPGFFAGEVTAELLDPSGVLSGHYLLDVSPDPAKLGRETFNKMLDELWQADPSYVIGTEPATTMVGGLGESQNVWVEFSRLRRHAPDFLYALAAVRSRPRRALVVRRASEPLHHVRRVDRHTAIGLSRSPAVAVLFADRVEEPASKADDRLDVPVVEDTLDSPANRTMLALLLAVLRRTRDLRLRLQESVEHERRSDTRTILATRWPVRRDFLLDLEARLKFLVGKTPFVDVRRPEITAAGLTAIAADPIYARAWGQGWRGLRHGLEGERNERLWVSPSWEVYERWCFVKLARLLTEYLPEWHWQKVSFDRWAGHKGSLRAEWLLQPRFRANMPSRAGFWSISKERVPDMVLLTRGPGELRFAVFDAKYRTTRESVLDAMESAHIYQDSLRISDQRPYASLLLVPAGGGAPWLEVPKFHLQHGVGVHVLTPRDKIQLPDVVSQLLPHSD